MTIKEINAKIIKIKDQIEVLNIEIEKINMEAATMSADLQEALNQLYLLPAKIKQVVQPIQPKITKAGLQNVYKKEKFSLLPENLKALLLVESYQIGLYFTLMPQQMTLCFNNESIKLSYKELYLLVIFAANQNVFLERNYLLETIWEEVTYYNSRSMDVYICKLRKLLSKDENVIIINSHSKGYTLLVTPLG